MTSESKVCSHIPETAAVAEFDLSELRVGCAHYLDGPTGITVFYFPRRVFGVVDVRGGAPAASLTDALRASYGKFIDALVFCGGSAYGLEAASGVASRLLARGLASIEWGEIAVVPSAAVYDFRGRHNAIYPDWALGATAFDSAWQGRFPLGAYGAGAFVHCGKLLGNDYMERAGQGGAFLQVGSTKIAVFTVVNAVGCLVDRSGAVVLGNRDSSSGIRLSPIQAIQRRHGWNCNSEESAGREDLAGNTTLTLVITNRKMTQSELQRLAVEVHTSMARPIQPFHTARDGDILFAVTTGDEDAASPQLATLSLYACELAWNAVLSCKMRELHV